jgi:hypothetical protein
MVRQLAISTRFSAPLPERGRESAVESENKRQPRTLMLPFTAPYDWKSILAFFSTRSIPGVEAVAMREMDAFPVKDIGILRGAEAVTGTRPSPNDLLLQAEAWRPWRAYAAQHLWAADSARDT